MSDEADGRPGLRELKKQQTRTALSWAAVRLSVERGVQNVRAEDIAAEAGVSLRTFRNYFANKAEAITARHLDRALLIADELRARPASEPLWTAIEHAVTANFAFGQQNTGTNPPDRQWADGVALLIQEPTLQGEMMKANAQAQQTLAAAVAERTGTNPDDLYPQLVAATTGAAITVASEHWMRAQRAVPMADLLRDALGQLAAGLPNP